MNMHERVYEEGKEINAYTLAQLIRKYDSMNSTLSEMLDEVTRHEDQTRKLFQEGNDQQAVMNMVIAHELRKWCEKLIDC